MFKKLEALDFSHTQITDAGCAALASALISGVLPALDTADVDDTPTSAAARAAVREALAAEIRGPSLSCNLRTLLITPSHEAKGTMYQVDNPW